MQALQIEYKNAKLRIEVDGSPSARLFINNIQREAQTGDKAPCTLRLGSSLQTDYEWHEFIEARVTFDANSVTISLAANNQQLASETFHAAL